MTVAGIDTTWIPERFRPLMTAVAHASARLSDMLRGRSDSLSTACARTLFADALQSPGIRWLYPAEDQAPVAVDGDGDLAMALTPLDGEADQDLNAPLASIFAIFPAAGDGQSSFLRPARDMLAAGYVLHGTHCCMVTSFGCGVQLSILDPAVSRFRLTSPQVRVPAHPQHDWPRTALRSSAGRRQAGSLAAEAHRILLRGGSFLCMDGDDLPRQLTVCAPLAFLVEQAGGVATDGISPLLAARIADLQARSPLNLGGAGSLGHHPLPEPEVPALFRHRGLFRVQGG
ncbi:hypothetical protein [Paracoccus beibuensis]|uniref:hypothetical protein n=1 Tax=Paracoccus beibuensis TaxID=547602 RepID=UPI00223FE9C8|nr:hypothetical protein [Paracoccus beibuensis]